VDAAPSKASRASIWSAVRGEGIPSLLTLYSPF
jgi:hypothetical protein